MNDQQDEKIIENNIRKPLLEMNKNKILSLYLDNLKKVYTHDWIFSTIVEKIIVLGSFFYTLFMIGKGIFGLF